MKSRDRRISIVNKLLSSKEPIPGSALAEEFGVSRQIIVQDIANLRSAGCDILSTHDGYMAVKAPVCERVLKLKHKTNETEDELSSIVKLGGTVVDVFVWHKIYGKISAPLNISTEYHIEKFLDGIRSGRSTEPMTVTGGYHYHTIRAEDEKTLDKIEEALKLKNYTVPEK